MTTMTSKYPGWCRKCKQSFPEGTQINWDKETKATHTKCPVVGVTAPAPTQVVSERMVVGIYEVDGQVWAVKMRKDKTGLYAMKMVQTDIQRATESGSRAKISFEYVYGVVVGYESKQIKLSDRMPIERAKELCTLYGRCLACNTALKAAKSVEQGIGPVCIKKFGPIINPTATTVDGRQVEVAA